MYGSESDELLEHPTRKLTALEVEDLVEGERRYTPDSADELDEPGACVTPVREVATARRVAKRTVRMRVFNFEPLARPSDERRSRFFELLEGVLESLTRRMSRAR